MADQFDLGQEMDAIHRQLAIDTQLRKSRRDVGMDTINCIDCGCEIPEKRREKQPGCVRCVDCQEVYERGAA